MSNLLKENLKKQEKDGLSSNAGLNLSNLVFYNSGNATSTLSTTSTTIANAVVNSTSTSNISYSNSDTISDIRGINERLIRNKSNLSNSSSSKYTQSNKIFDNFSLDNLISPVENSDIEYTSDFGNEDNLMKIYNSSIYDYDEDNMSPYNLRKKYGNEDLTSSNWVKHRKHFFILSSAGKPIYSRYGDESKLSSLMGVIQAIISFYDVDNDEICCINTSTHKIVFLLKTPLYLVCVSQTNETEEQLKLQLIYLYNQILFSLTSVQLTKIFHDRVNFDLRNLLSGTEIYMDELSRKFSIDASFLLKAIRSFRIKNELRNSIGELLNTYRPKNILYGILTYNDKLINIIKPKKQNVHPLDIHLIINMISSTSFRSVESWSPICLPKYNSRGFLYAYVCYLNNYKLSDTEDSNSNTNTNLSSESPISPDSSKIMKTDVCLTLLSPDKNAFFELSNCKKKIEMIFNKNDILKNLSKIINKAELDIADFGIPHLRHVIYKSTKYLQFIETKRLPPYDEPSSYRRLLRSYKFLESKIHGYKKNLKFCYMLGKNELSLLWVRDDFELYASFSPFISKTIAYNDLLLIEKWFKKQDNLFITTSQVF
ncbi:DUF254-domain-containing protein [Anaeromyces robustus]|uniref:Vacuolar fusion protein MON1 n=1 Tax=Anaeromyces robustus TaxID=1754192 RepID=A0A1Y1WQE3_9FUNG|nr:DUF254-domain-containing protein [Anaeromyces robustus]|eukprot:ORX75692.1 DUF254-domain-containing protein [Anaeromyces robustus]